MKKVLSILVLALVAVQFAFAGDVITQDTKQLPLTARNFINQYFSKPHISHIKIESEILQTKKYESAVDRLYGNRLRQERKLVGSGLQEVRCSRSIDSGSGKGVCEG